MNKISKDPTSDERFNETVRYGIVYPIVLILIAGFFEWLTS